jgi:hypothetical protein
MMLPTAFRLTVILGVSIPTIAHGQSLCTPGHLLQTLRHVEAQCGKVKSWHGYRRGASIRGTRRVSQHAFCNGVNGAIDAIFSNRACAVAALRKTRYSVITYGWSPHVHFGTDAWGSGRRNRGQVHVAATKTWPRTLQDSAEGSFASSSFGDSGWSDGGPDARARSDGGGWRDASSADNSRSAGPVRRGLSRPSRSLRVAKRRR